jgi:hypothetical protein
MTFPKRAPITGTNKPDTHKGVGVQHQFKTFASEKQIAKQTQLLELRLVINATLFMC